MFFTYDLVSRGKNVADENQCYGEYNSTTGKGYGGGYANNCIHSGAIRASGDLPTTWYNYTLASANTISEDTDSDHPASNTEKATESICPKGWTLPTNTQINANRDVAGFSPVWGGVYGNDTLYGEDTYGFWWGSEASNGAVRYRLGYYGSLYTSDSSRNNGLYIRCVPAP